MLNTHTSQIQVLMRNALDVVQLNDILLFNYKRVN